MHAKILLVIFKMLIFVDTVSNNPKIRSTNKARQEDIESEWMDGLSQSGLSGDSIPIVYHFPHLITMAMHVCFYHKYATRMLSDFVAESFAGHAYEYGKGCQVKSGQRSRCKREEWSTFVCQEIH
jgi:hypothetical protein